jgi:hypothetical protein
MVEVARELYAKADTQRLEGGNLSEVESLEVLNTARREVSCNGL